MRIHRAHEMIYRWIAIILCLALCLGSTSLNALAKETGVGIEVTQNDMVALPEEGVGESNDSTDQGYTDNSGAADHDEAGADAGQPYDIGDTDDSGQESDVDDPTGSENAEDADQNDSNDDLGDGGETDKDNPNYNDGSATVDETEGADDSVGDNNTDSVPENGVDSLSENDLTSVSENDLEDSAVKRNTLIKSAEEGFEYLLTKKGLMALLYHTDNYGARSEADGDSAVTATLAIGQTLYINGVRITDDDVWYLVQYWLDGVEGTGYVQSYYLAYSDEDWIAWEEKYLLPILESGDGEYGNSAYGMAAYSMVPYAIDTSDITAFPGSYQAALRELKSAHPNWTFVPMKTGLDFNTSVSKEMGAKSLIQKTTSNSSKGWVGDACPSESGWYYATQPAVASHMDPRNFLTETYIFQFEQLTFNASYHTEAAVQTFLNGTFMKGKLADDSQDRTYAKAFYEIGKGRKLSPIHLASRVYQEQGQGTSGLISGTYPGYEGYYNFFNVGVNGASTEEKIVKGLTYAKEKGWNTRYKSLEGGAATIGNNYILKYQDTIYLEKFNVDKNSPYGVYEHQYMQNIQAPSSESSSTRKMYANAGSLNSAFVFKIPVFDNMPEDQYYPTLRLNSTSITLDRSKAADCESGQQLKLYVDDVEVNPSEAMWKSSDSSVVTVQDGLVKIAGGEESGKAGEAVITATYQEIEVSCKVKVIISLQEITLDKTEIRLRRPDTVVADTTNLNATEKAENTDTASLQVSYVPTDTTADQTITWTSSNGKIATVKADPSDPARAIVRAVGKGEVTITAKTSKAGNKTASCKVYVSAPIYQVTLTNRNAQETDPENPKQETTLLAGQSINLSVEYLPMDTTSDTKVIWSSSDPKVATVENGKVTAVGENPDKNTAVITAKMAGCEQGYSAQHTVVVENCIVTFMKPKTDSTGMAVLGDPQRVLYGGTLSAETLLSMEQMLAKEQLPDAETTSLFIGWYTGENGTGSRFDETTTIYGRNTTLYPYYEEQGKGFYILPIGDQTYTGGAIKPVVQVYDSVSYEDGGRELIELTLNKDYTVSYKNNKNVNLEGKAQPTITVKGKGNYAGTEKATFNIVPKALTDADIIADDITVAYSGKVIKSAPTVYRNGKKLVKNTDYTVTYPRTGSGAYQAAGTYPIVIGGKGGYSGTITIRQTITQEVLMSKVSIAKIPNQTYSNELMNKEHCIKPETLKVTYKNQTLVESKDGGLTGDYTVIYTNNTAIGTATATITAVEGSGYAGSKSINYKIVGTSIARAKVEGIAAREYTGKEEDARQPDGVYTLTLNDRVLVESTDNGLTGDYLVSYKNTAKVGTATVTFQGINEYTGQIRKTYKITAYNISSDDGGQNPAITMKYYTQDEPYTQDKPERLKQVATLSEITAPYVKGGTKPVVLLYFNENQLIAGKDYTIKYANNNAVTPACSEEWAESRLPKITITGKGNFKGSIVGRYRITDGQMAQDNGKLTMTAKDMVYKGKKNTWKSAAVLKDCNGSKLAAGRDYDRNLIYTYAESVSWNDVDGNKIVRGAGDSVEAEDIPAAGTVIRVTAKGMGAYVGEASGGEESPATISATYRIVEADIAKAKVTVKAQVYRNGREITLTPEDLKVTMSGNPEKLVLGVDYVIDADTYTNHTNKGKAAVTIRGIGNYGGEKKITYTIGSKTLVWWKNLIF